MALASGIPVPPVFVLDHESGINAFAAGHQPGDAVVAVSAGCLQYLTREELQGVMGHEFSHILNGDMRLNLRLIGIVYGILVLAILGYYVMRIAGASSGGSKREGGAVGFFFLGLALLIFGYLGVFFGNLIKSAISRQREFLADASSVQFTRNPGGITGALKKIGGLAEGSRIRDAHAAGNQPHVLRRRPSSIFLPRTRRWTSGSGRLSRSLTAVFPRSRPLAVTDEDAQRNAPPDCNRGAFRGKRREPFWGGRRELSCQTSAHCYGRGRSARGMGLDAGNLTRTDRPTAGRTPATCGPDDGRDAAIAAGRRPRAVCRPGGHLRTLAEPGRRGDQGPATATAPSTDRTAAVRETRQLMAAVQALSAAARLPLVALCIPAIKRSSPQQYVQFRQVVDALVGADGRVDLFEYCLRTVLFSYLDVPFGLRKPPAIRYRAINMVAQPAAVVLSTLAYVGQKEPADVQRAFQAGAQNLLGQAVLLPAEQCTLQNFDRALAELAQASPNVKQAVIAGVAACIMADGQVTVEEGELLRAIAAVLACPMPPGM